MYDVANISNYKTKDNVIATKTNIQNNSPRKHIATNGSKTHKKEI